MEAKHIVQQEKQTNLTELKTVYLVGVYPSGGDKFMGEESLQELHRLCDTFGLEVVGQVLYPFKKLDSGTYLGQGNIDAVGESSKEVGAKIILFDDEITPNQQRNLENQFKMPVIDRTEIIIEVFAQRAQSKEAQLQVELAKIKYQFPRLRRMWTHLSRQSSGGGGHVKGEGEKQIEIDRRLLRKRIDIMNKEIKAVAVQRNTQRTARKRSGIPVFSIVGYTNAGKSTLMKSMTGAEVLVEDKLFATLDTTTRKYTLPNKQEVLLVDTVGFIRKIPHTLVVAFKSTLEEAVHTDILIHLIDVSHPLAEDHAEATMKVLRELKAVDQPIITVLNKVDACEDQVLLMKLKFKYPRTVLISALDPKTLEELQERMVEALASLRSLLNLRIPQSEYALIAELMKEGNVHSSDYEENDVLLKIEIPKQIEYKVKKFIQD
jgi:GTPase